MIRIFQTARATRPGRNQTAAIAALATYLTAACASPPPAGPDVPAIALVLRGSVVTADGYPAAGVRVRSHAYRPDCSTPIVTDRDTLLVTDPAGTFRGILLTQPGVRQACLRVVAEQQGGPSATRTLQVVFRPADPAGNVDTAFVQIALP